MSSTKAQEKIRQLQAEGFTIKTPLPEEYEEVFERLTAQEIKSLISAKKKFDEAQAKSRDEVGPYTTYLLPF
jgi:hypothetical protein